MPDKIVDFRERRRKIRRERAAANADPHVMRQNLAAVVVVLALLAIGYWLYVNMASLNRSLGCLQTGRTNCDVIRPAN